MRGGGGINVFEEEVGDEGGILTGIAGSGFEGGKLGRHNARGRGARGEGDLQETCGCAVVEYTKSLLWAFSSRVERSVGSDCETRSEGFFGTLFHERSSTWVKVTGAGLLGIIGAKW